MALVLYRRRKKRGEEQPKKRGTFMWIKDVNTLKRTLMIVGLAIVTPQFKDEVKNKMPSPDVDIGDSCTNGQPPNSSVLAFQNRPVRFRSRATSPDSSLLDSCHRWRRATLQRSLNPSFEPLQPEPPTHPRDTLINEDTEQNQQHNYRDQKREGIQSSSRQEDILVWEPTDVNRDLLLLRRGIEFARRDETLKALKRVEALNYMATSNKRQVFPDVQKYIMFPMAVAWLLYKVSTKSGGTVMGTYARRLIRIACVGFDFHFWVMIVIAPSLMVLAERMEIASSTTMGRRRQKSTEAKQTKVDRDDEKLVKSNRPFILSHLDEDRTLDSDITDPSARTSVSFIIEYWVSAVTGMVAAPLLAYIGRKIIWCLRSSASSSASASASWMVLMSALLRLIQLFTRIAAMASIHQYPKMLFEVTRESQSRPIEFSTFAARFLMRSLFITAPLGLAMDFYKVLLLLPSNMIKPMYGSAALVIYGTWTRMAWLRKEAREDEENVHDFARLSPRPALVRTTYAIANFFLWREQLHLMGAGVAKFVVNSTVNRWLSLLVLIILAAMPLAPSLAHLKCIGDIMRIEHTHNISMITTQNAYRSDSLKDIEVLEDRIQQYTKWRYRLGWRDPQRLHVTLKKYPNDLSYWLFLKGGAEDQFEEQTKRLYNSRFLMSENFILNKLKKDRESGPSASKNTDRESWKPQAMEKLRQEHEQDYLANNKTLSFKDPLGVALQQTLNVGLGFNFDYQTPLKSDEKPSLRRLQARAAQSAVQRIQQLRRFNASEEDIQNQRSFLVQELTELIPQPTDDEPSDNLFSNERISQFLPKSGKRKGFFKKVSDHEARFIPLPSDEASPSTETAQSQFIANWEVSSESVETGFSDDESTVVEDLRAMIEEEMRAAKTPYPQNMRERDDHFDDKDAQDEDKDRWEPEIFYC